MESKKSVLESKTILGALASLAPTVLPIIGIAFGSDAAHLFSSAVDALLQIGGVGLAIYGRIVADSKITTSIK